MKLVTNIVAFMLCTATCVGHAATGVVFSAMSPAGYLNLDSQYLHAMAFKFSGPHDFSVSRVSLNLTGKTFGRVNVDAYTSTLGDPPEMVSFLNHMGSVDLGPTDKGVYSLSSTAPTILKPNQVIWFVVSMDSGTAVWSGSAGYGYLTFEGATVNEVRQMDRTTTTAWSNSGGGQPSFEIEISDTIPTVPEPTASSLAIYGILAIAFIRKRNASEAEKNPRFVNPQDENPRP